MKITGILIIVLSLLLPLAGFVDMGRQYPPAPLFSLYCGAAAIILMAWSLVIATRLPVLERLFGPLDRMYVLHKWLGIGAIACVTLHDVIDPDIRGFPNGTPLAGFGEELGSLGYDTLIVLVLLSIATFVPYRLWRYSHLLMGGVFALSALHFVLVDSPVTLTKPVGLFVLAFCLAGLAAFAFTLAGFGLRRTPFRYAVETVEEAGDVTVVTMAPTGRGLSWEAGQFAFFAFGEGVLNEVHPFTISCGPNPERRLRISVRGLGHYTRGLAHRIGPGTSVRVSHAYGRFRRGGRARGQIWIAGGIGIAPFAAMADALTGEEGPVHLFYSVRERAEAVHLAELERHAARLPAFHLHLSVSGEEGRLDAERIARESGLDLPRAAVWFCGPRAMRDALRAGLVARGLPRGRFHHEEFEIRTGVGLGWLWDRAAGLLRRWRRPDAQPAQGR